MNKKTTAKALLVTMGLSVLMPASAFAATDVNGHWAEGVLTKWENQKLIAGYDDGTIRPDAPITRAEFVALVNRVGGFAESAASVTFTDVKDSDWYAKQVAIAVNKGFIGGFEDNTFRPGEYVTRAQAASMIARFENLAADTERAEAFADKEKTPDWAKGVVGAVANAGYMIGDENNCFNAPEYLTRAEAVAALDRIFKVQGEDSKTDTEKPVVNIGGGGGSSTSDNTVTVVMDADQITVPDGVDKELISIRTVVDKYADPGERDVITHVTMPDYLEVTKVTLPAGSNFDTTYGDKTYKMTLVTDLVKYQAENITVGNVLDVIDPKSEAAEVLKTLNQDRVLIECTQTEDGDLHWHIDGKSWREQVAVFEMLEVTIEEVPSAE